MSTGTAATPRSYGLRDFAELYVLSQANWTDPIGGYLQGRSEYNKALRAYRERMLSALEELFDLKLEMGKMVDIPRGTVLFMHFRKTVHSCLALRTPGSGYQETGLLIRSLEAAGESGQRILAKSTRIEQLTKSSQEAHLDILEDLLLILLGQRGHQTFTHADLRSCGVDDAEPASADYPSDD